MVEPTQPDIGRKVIYRDLRRPIAEEGTITSFNSDYVFVRYSWSGQGVATKRSDLEWL